MNKFKGYFNTLEDVKKAFYYADRKMTFLDFFDR